MTSGLPELDDFSLEGREAFLATWEPVLWAYWRDAYAAALTDGEAWLRAAEARAGGRNNAQAGQWIAEQILKALRTRPRLDFAPAWTNLSGWYGWWVGRRAMAAQQRASNFTSLDEEHPGAAGHSPEDALVDRLDRNRRMKQLLALIDGWARILGRISEGTGLPDIEADWLWATCIARRPLARLLLEVGMGDARFQEVDKSILLAKTSVPGDASKERTARSRKGAAAALRFNLEALLPRNAKLAPAHHVFLGPVRDPREAPALPARPVTDEALWGFREVLRLSSRPAESVERESPLEALWTQVFEAALKKAVARLLPTAYRKQLEQDLADWVGAQAREEQE
ncbi:hypothetical protein [Corallococcus aberystwythensis]|uniref:Uncharacterized protein n=1 Tax=Corallococcus aberystwythensis TaxID=2316722 RepID=A0A3A8QYU6_9BACT|nr:hypothetical protein [Corallococcus aberystwythensis]RKH72961.1 hypothetical protein D7W81_05065 [Corallococcus aberystwythensis]